MTVVFRPLAVLQQQALERTHAWVELLIVIVICLALDASLFLVSRSRDVSNEGALDFALLYEVLRCFVMGLSMVRFDGLYGLEPPAITFDLVLLILFPLVVPMRPLKAVLVSIVAASLHPLSLILFSPVVVPGLILAHAVLASVLAVAFAALCGRVGYALTARAADGAELGSYRLEELLDRDECGELWRASHRLLARPAAVKMIPPTLLNRPDAAQARSHFREEAFIAASLTSSYTVTLYDYGISESGWTYRATELLDGEALARWVARDEPRSLEQVLTMATGICDSLAEAHEAGLVHGNLTPDHVYVCRAGQRRDFVKVGGYARIRLGERTKASCSENDARGWSQFNAPEIAAGAPESTHTDIYQFGRLLQFMLGKLSPQVSAVPAELRELVERAVADDPDVRFESSRELLETLRPFSGTRELALGHVLSGRGARRRKSKSGSGSGRRVKLPHVGREPLVLTVGPTRGQVGTILGQDPASHGNSAEVLDAARHRLAHVGLICAGTGCLGLALVGLSPPASGDLAKLSVVLGAGLVGVTLDVALLLISRAAALSTKSALRLAVVYFVIRCWVFGVVATLLYGMYGLAAPRVTFGAVFLVLLSAFVPLTPKQVVAPVLLAATGRVLSVWWFVPEEQVDWRLTAIYVGLVVCASTFGAYIMSSLNFAASMGGTYGAYRLTRKIGSGGMGEVWKAEHELLARPAAIKLIRNIDAASDEEVAARWRRFEKEAYATSLLTSPHTVRLYDYGVSDDGTYYYVMELLDGVTLRALVGRAGPLTPEQAITVGLQVCDSLAEAHERGVVHRDLKPENLFLTRAGCDPGFVKVLDFGLVHFFGELKSLRSDAVRKAVVGTPAYMSPEALFGREVDVRSDIYQLGCVLHFLLTGQPPFRGSNLAELAWAHARKSAPRPSAASPHDVPKELDDIVRHCLAKEPAERFGSATELSAALEVAGAALAGRRPEPAHREAPFLASPHHV